MIIKSKKNYIYDRLNKEGKSKINSFNQKDSLIKLKSNQNALLKLSKTNYDYKILIMKKQLYMIKDHI